MTMPGRRYNVGSDYRYGFNGKENDKDISEGRQDYEARIYDVRLGRWLSVDRYSFSYPNISPYAFALNSPLLLLDSKGNTVIVYDNAGKAIATINKSGTTFHTSDGSQNSFYKAYVASKAYIQQNNNTDLFTQCENRRETVNLLPLNATTVPNEIRGKGPQFIPEMKDGKRTGNGTLLWDPNTGLEVSENNYNSPAGVLVHELIHFESTADDPVKAQKEHDNQYKDVELTGSLKGMILKNSKSELDNEGEEKTIAKTNLILKKIFGEASNRTTHRGKLVSTAGPTKTPPLFIPLIKDGTYRRPPPKTNN